MSWLLIIDITDKLRMVRLKWHSHVLRKGAELAIGKHDTTRPEVSQIKERGHW